MNLFPKSENNHLNQIIMEVVTLLIILFITIWSVQPLLEEWQTLHVFNLYGLEYFYSNSLGIAMRPLHLTAYVIQWLLGGGMPYGVTIGVSLTIVLRYFALSWAIAPLNIGPYRWVLATLAAILVGWTGTWLGRFMPATLASVFFFLALGFSIRLAQKWSIFYASGCVLSVAFILLSYQGLALCLIVIPVMPLIWSEKGSIENKEKIKQALRMAYPIALTFIIYGIYWILMSENGPEGYDATLANDGARLLSIEGLAQHIKSAYVTAYSENSTLLPFLILIAFSILRLTCIENVTKKEKNKQKIIILMIIALLPLLSLIYVNQLHIHDIERVLYPVSIGFVLACIFIVKKNHSGTINYNILYGNFAIIVICIVLSGFIQAYKVKQFANVENEVIRQSLKQLKIHNAKRIIIKDTTGTLGDVYTFLPPILSDALAVYGENVQAIICTPLSVDRNHPIANRFPIESTPRCEELLKSSENTLELTAYSIDGNLVLK